jgi:Possible lysine decarboxylase
VAQSGFVNDLSTATEDALRRAVDTTPAFIHTARPDGYLDYFNRGWLDFLGKPLEDVCGWRWNARRTVRSDYPDSDPQDHKGFPVVIMGTDYWHQILRFIEQMAKARMIAPSDMQVVYVTDSVDDAIAHIRSHAIERFALLALRRVRPHLSWLGERGLPPLLIALSNLRPPGPPARRLPP